MADLLTHPPAVGPEPAHPTATQPTDTTMNAAPTPAPAPTSWAGLVRRQPVVQSGRPTLPFGGAGSAADVPRPRYPLPLDDDNQHLLLTGEPQGAGGATLVLPQPPGDDLLPVVRLAEPAADPARELGRGVAHAARDDVRPRLPELRAPPADALGAVAEAKLGRDPVRELRVRQARVREEAAVEPVEPLGRERRPVPPCVRGRRVPPDRASGPRPGPSRRGRPRRGGEDRDRSPLPRQVQRLPVTDKIRQRRRGGQGDCER